jgi:hypothetical protein
LSWDAVGSVAEVVGALGVILSLLYLAAQIRQGLRSAEDTATKEVIASVVVQFNAMAEESNRSSITKGLIDYRNLSGDEKLTFDSLMTSLLMIVSSSFMSNRANLLTDDLFSGWSGYLQPRLFPYPGMREWWDEARNVFIPEVQAWVDKEFAKADTDQDFWGIK